MRVKICGITSFDQARSIAELGATDLGFICAPQSTRYIAPEALTAIIQALGIAGIQVGTVGVFVNEPVEAMAAVVHQSGLKTVQLHGQETIHDCQDLRQVLPGVELLKAIRIRTPEDLTLACSYSQWVDGLLLDAYHPDQYGGTGQTLDWVTLQGFKPSCPWLLAGGLNPDNIQTALSLVSPDGIDLSSGVEKSPGVKDLDLVSALFEQLSCG